MKKYWILFIVIIFIAAVPRIVELLAGNYLFLFDQGLFYSDVKKIVVDHKLTLIGSPVGGPGGFFQGAGWYYLLAIPFFFAKGNPYGGMVLMFLIGIATVALALFLGKKMFSWKEGVFIGFLIAASPNIIPQARFIWPPFPISLLTVLFLFFFYKILQKEKYYLVLLAFTIGLMSHFETATAATLLLEYILFSPLLFWKKLISVKSFFLAAGAFFLTQLPQVLFYLRHQSLIGRGLSMMTGSFNTPHQVLKENYITIITQNHFAVFASGFANMFPYLGAFWVVIAAVSIIGSLFYIFDKNNSFEKKYFVLYLLVSPFLLFAVFLLYKMAIWSWWILELSIFYCFLLGILLAYFFQKNSIFKVMTIFILFYFAFVYGLYTRNAYIHDYPDYGGTAKIKGKIDAIDSIYKDAQGKPFGLFIFSPPVYTYPYDYLLWWYGQKTYHYLPYREKKGIFYLLIETDPEKLWSYNGWLETVIKDGKIVTTKTLSSGFIVQKRIAEK